jgi:hypothetical protein
MAKKPQSEQELLVSEINMYTKGEPDKTVRIGQFFYADRSMASDMILGRIASKPTQQERDWLKNQPKGTYNRRDMNARD